MSKVNVWYMTKEERLAYIEKHPIRPISKKKIKQNEGAFANINKGEWRSDISKVLKNK